MPDKTSGRGFVANTVALIGAIATLLAATGAFIQAVHPGGLAFEFEAASASPTATASPTPTASPTASPTAPRSTAPVTAQPTTGGMCVPFRIGTTNVTVTRFDPSWDDPGILVFGDRFIRLRLPTRNVRVGVTVENQGTASLTLTSQNWRLFDGNPSYALMSPAPSPSPAYTNRLVAPNARFSGFVIFTGIPRDVTALQLEAKFGTQSVIFKLPTDVTDCSP